MTPIKKKLRLVVPKKPKKSEYQDAEFGFILKHEKAKAKKKLGEGLVSQFYQNGHQIGQVHHDAPKSEKKYSYKDVLQSKEYLQKYGGTEKHAPVTVKIAHHEPNSWDKHKDDKAHHHRQEKIEHLDANLRGHYSNYTHEHKKAIAHYTGAASKHINNALLGKPHDKDELDVDGHDAKHIAKQVPILKSALKAHTTPHDMVVHTGMTRSSTKAIKEASQKSKKDIKIHLPAFTSTSIDKTVARGFAKPDDTHTQKHIVSIHVPKGSHGGYVEHHTGAPEEKEFVLHPGAKVHISHEPTLKPDPHRTGMTVHHWYGKLVHDGVKHVGEGADAKNKPKKFKSTGTVKAKKKTKVPA